MTSKLNTVDLNAFAKATEAFVALSGVYLDCTAQLSNNAIALTREALQECVATTKHAGIAKTAVDPVTLPFNLARSLLEKTLASTRDGYEALMKAQLESARIIGGQVATSAMAFPDTNEWKDAANMFSRAFRDFSAQAGTAFSEAGMSAHKTAYPSRAA